MSTFKTYLIEKKQLISQVEGQIVSDMNGEKVMLSVKNGKYYNLGRIGGDIWELINSPKTLDDLVVSLTEKYEVSVQDCRIQVERFLEMLWNEGLVKVTEKQ
ncbi:lasso peptide biosynthesis PqqD family chaperone [Niallia taxi]|uniref:lasso peptide biosynthesis PqqD family chaperone n=1 Tax=Niallia taxi TaxID=2499688 RepID=UPI003981B17B